MTLGSHQKSIGTSQVHITPKWIIDALGPFDLDPCAAYPRPWDCAQFNMAAHDDGLVMSWPADLFVWLNPPFHRHQVGAWINKLVEHGSGIALLHARTETAWFRPIWQHADMVLFMARRITFCKPDGSPCTTQKGLPANSGAPPVLAAFGDTAAERLGDSGIAGAYLHDWDYRA